MKTHNIYELNWTELNWVNSLFENTEDVQTHSWQGHYTNSKNHERRVKDGHSICTTKFEKENKFCWRAISESNKEQKLCDEFWNRRCHFEIVILGLIDAAFPMRMCFAEPVNFNQSINHSINQSNWEDGKTVSFNQSINASCTGPAQLNTYWNISIELPVDVLFN